MTSRRRNIADRLVRGAAAGAAGTTALNVIAYGDMLVRARPASDVPADVAGILAGEAGIGLLAPKNDTESARVRRQAMGAWLGYTTGVAVGIIYGLAHPRLGRPSNLAAGLALGLAAMAASDLPILVTGASDPRTWSLTDWISDAAPHLIYGLATAAVYELSAGE